MRVTYTDPATNQKKPLAGARVIPTITKEADELVPDDLANIGEMWPEMGITDANGIVSFGYLFKGDMDFTTADTETFTMGVTTGGIAEFLIRRFHMRFYLVDYRPYKLDDAGDPVFDSDGNHLFETAAVKYCVTGVKGVNVPTPAPLEGQGQVVGSNMESPNVITSKMTVHTATEAQTVFFGFKITNGDRDLEMVETPEDTGLVEYVECHPICTL